MKYTVRRKLETYEIRDEEHHLAGRVRRSLCSGCRLSAEDAESGIFYEVTREKGALVIQEAEGNPAYCKIRYLEDAAGYARPPMALETELEAGDRTLMLRQKKNRTFAILENGRNTPYDVQKQGTGSGRGRSEAVQLPAVRGRVSDAARR